MESKIYSAIVTDGNREGSITSDSIHDLCVDVLHELADRFGGTHHQCNAWYAASPDDDDEALDFVRHAVTFLHQQSEMITVSLLQLTIAIEGDKLDCDLEFI